MVQAATEGLKAIKTPALLKEIRKRSVQEKGDGSSVPTLLMIATAADEAPTWWSAQRDVYLRKFYPQEPFLCGALYSVLARNASYTLDFEGDAAAVKKAHQLKANCNFFKGWQNLALLTSLDLYSQDNGAFIEIVRPARAKILGNLESVHPYYERYNGKSLKAAKMLVKGGSEDPQWCGLLPYPNQWVPLDGVDYKLQDSPMDLPISLAHLDAAACERTGDPENPVLYTDVKGKQHRLKWYQVATMEDMPSADRTKHGVGLSAVSRALRIAQTLRDTQIYKQEKITGQNVSSIWLTNVSADLITDAIEQARDSALNKHLLRYMQPVIAETLDPAATPAVQEIKLASLPDNYNEDEMLRWYIAALALDFGVDYGFLAPLPGNKLGTSQQAEVMERQSRGKASRLYMSLMENILNNHAILPQNVVAEYKEVDVTEELERDTATQRRAKTRSIMIASGEITAGMAREMAVRAGDYTEDIASEADEEEEEEQEEPETDRRWPNLGFGKKPKRQTVETEEAKQLKKGLGQRIRNALTP
jgi:hypothetical protein